MTHYPFLAPETIEAHATQFLREYHPDGSYPVPIEDIVELRLKLEIVTAKGLMQLLEIDGFLSRDFKQITIDEDQYMHRPTRARFTLAHECGHLVMHKDFLAEHAITSTDHWKRIVLGDSSGRAPLETQANMFAGFVLMPTPALEIAIREAKAELAQNPVFKGKQLPPDKTLYPYLAKPLAKRFDISEQAAGMRLAHL